MLQFIMDQNLLLYVLAAACAIGVVSQMILKRVYDGLIRDTKNTGEPVGRFLQLLRQRFQYCSHLNEKVGDVQSLIRKSLMEFRFWGISLHQWSRIGVGCLAVSLLCAFAGTMALVQEGAQIVSGNTYFWMGLLAAAFTIAAYAISDIGYRGKALETHLTDYLQNSGAVREFLEEAEEDSAELEYGASASAAPVVTVAEGRKARRRARAETAAAAAVETRAQREKRELKENLARMKTGMQETAAEREKERVGESLRQMDPKEQERILREVLKEFLS